MGGHRIDLETFNPTLIGTGFEFTGDTLKKGRKALFKTKKKTVFKQADPGKKVTEALEQSQRASLAARGRQARVGIRESVLGAERGSARRTLGGV
jgi:hypothetical protein